MIQDSRIQLLNKNPVNRNGRFVIYWMQQAQRVRFNHALAYAIGYANDHSLPLITVFGLTAKFPEANARHYDFMLNGLVEVEQKLEKMGIPFVIQYGSPDDVLLMCSNNAAAVVTDRGYLEIQKKWREEASQKIDCPLIQVESDVVVPVEAVSRKEEYSAATIRPKINRLLADYVKPLEIPALVHRNCQHDLQKINLKNIPHIIGGLGIDMSVKPVAWLKPGENGAQKVLEKFIKEKLDLFAAKRNDPACSAVSNLSPYLHFGQISPIDIALAVLECKSSGKEPYIEELVVRRELAMNYVNNNPDYHSYYALPAWAKATLFTHEKDKREYLYTKQQFESADTHDSYWNAAQTEMVKTGKMHGYMRMYWGKKLIEWSKTPEEAFETAVYLNNKYELDGRDPNGYAGVAWCFGKHDRPWKERPIFGMVRFMNSAGLERKFDISSYVTLVTDM